MHARPSQPGATAVTAVQETLHPVCAAHTVSITLSSLCSQLAKERASVGILNVWLILIIT